MTTSSPERTSFPASEIGTLYHDDDRSISEKYGKFGAPYFKIEISDNDDRILFSAANLLEHGGYDLNGLIVNDVDFEESTEEADVITITINNPKCDLQDSPLFVEGNNIDVFMGYDGHAPFFMGRGIIVEIAPEFPADGMPTIKLTSYDKSYFMMEEGKAEIVPEGSAWWERRQQQAYAPERTTLIRYNDAHPNMDAVGDDLAEIERVNAIAEEQGEDVLMESVGAMSAYEDGIDIGLEEVEGGEIEVEGSGDPRVDAFMEEQGLERRRSANTWQQQSFSRRRRNAGKVWTNKTDSEIVAEIFRSYGIVPYVEATNENVRRSTNANRSSSYSGTGSSRNGRQYSRIEYDQFEEDVAEGERLRVLEEQVGEDESLEEAQERLSEEAAATSDPNEELSIFSDPTDYVPDSASGDDVAWAIDTERDLNYLVGQVGIDLTEEERLTFRDQFRDDLTFRQVYQQDFTPPQPNSNANADHSVTQKAGTTDWEFIKMLADKHGFIVFVFFHIDSRRWIGYWGPETNVPQYREFVFRFNQGDDSTIANIRPNISMRNQSTEIDLLFVDPVTRKENRLRVSMENVSEYMPEAREAQRITEPIGNGPEVVLTVHGQRVRVNADHRFTSAEDARRWLVNFWLRHAQDFLILEGDTVIGIPELRAREHHFFEGIGRFSGRFFVTLTRHNMSPGQKYSTSFVARIESPFPIDVPDSDLVVLDQNELGESEAGVVSDTIVL